LAPQGDMALTDKQGIKVQANSKGASKNHQQPAQRGSNTVVRPDTRRSRERILHAFKKFMIGAAGIAMAFHPARIGCLVGNPVTLANAEANQRTLTLQQISHLDQNGFEQSLPQLRQAMEHPAPKAVADPETLAAIAGKLRRADESTPDYWPTVLRFIPFASSRMAKNPLPQGQQPRFLSDILSVGLMRGVREVDKTILFDEGYLGNGEFKNCRIIFTQNPVRLTSAHFRNCVFELPTTDPPTAYTKIVSHILLSSDLSLVSISTL
jgi:hypothetical protein